MIEYTQKVNRCTVRVICMKYALVLSEKQWQIYTFQYFEAEFLLFQNEMFFQLLALQTEAGFQFSIRLQFNADISGNCEHVCLQFTSMVTEM